MSRVLVCALTEEAGLAVVGEDGENAGLQGGDDGDMAGQHAKLAIRGGDVHLRHLMLIEDGLLSRGGGRGFTGRMRRNSRLRKKAQ